MNLNHLVGRPVEEWPFKVKAVELTRENKLVKGIVIVDGKKFYLKRQFYPNGLAYFKIEPL